MSQVIKNLASGPVPPAVPTSFVTQNGTAVPAANILLVNGFDSSQNNDNGIITKGGVVGTGTANELDVVLTNRVTATVSTTDATLTTILTFPLGGTPATYTVQGNIQAFGGVNAGSYEFAGGYLTDGANATELGTEFHNQFETLSMQTSDIFLSVDGSNNLVVSVQGIAASLNWNLVMTYRMVT